MSQHPGREVGVFQRVSGHVRVQCVPGHVSGGQVLAGGTGDARALFLQNDSTTNLSGTGDLTAADTTKTIEIDNVADASPDLLVSDPALYVSTVQVLGTGDGLINATELATGLTPLKVTGLDGDLTSVTVTVAAYGQSPVTATIDPATIDWTAMSGRRFPYRLRQEPGEGNALGTMKFMFPNRHNIYIHDTPARDLFERTVRSFSHGCIRVENPDGSRPCCSGNTTAGPWRRSAPPSPRANGGSSI